ncbi:MAG: hypothetical protein Q9167_007654 [Letrouitia subvulpina]
MSLNGLNASDINDAYQSAQGEGGGCTKGLTDSALSAACSLHTASASIKSSSDSLRQPSLSEIAEDVNENQPITPETEQVAHSRKGSSDSLRTQVQRQRPDSLISAFNPQRSSSTRRKESPSPSRTIRNTDKALPPTPNDSAGDKPTTRSTLEDSILVSRESVDGRPSFQSTRPSVRSLRTSYDFKPKIKLGPRPSLESTRRTYSHEKVNDPRPISTLPNGVRMPAKMATTARPKSAHDAKQLSEPLQASKPSSVPSPGAATTEKSSALPKGSSRSTHTSDLKMSSMTPEKRRLRKALELRQKQIAARGDVLTSNNKPAPTTKESKDVSDPAKRQSLTSTLPDVSSTEDNPYILQERIKEFSEDPDIVRVGVGDLGKGTTETFEASPLSIPEVSDGSSTRTSSVTDEDERLTNETPKDANKAQGESSNQRADGEPLVIPLTAPAVTMEHRIESQSSEELSNESELANGGHIPAGEASDFHGGSKELEKILPTQQHHVESDKEEQDTFTSADSRANHDHNASLLARRTSGSKAVPTSLDTVLPHEVPLPQIDEDEETTLTPSQAAFMESKVEPATVNKQSSHSQTVPDSRVDSDTRPSTADTIGDQRDRKARRQGLINPIKRVSSPDFSDDHFLSDDSFMEELKKATVQEAKPISVSKSPITPVFPKSVHDQKSLENLRPISSSSRLNKLQRQDKTQMMPKLPDLYSARSVSASSAPLSDAQLSPPMLKRVGVSSGISQRIKALEQLSSRPTSPSSSQLSSPITPSTISPAFPNVRKPSFRATQAAAEIAKANVVSSKNNLKMPSPSPSPSEHRPNPFNEVMAPVDVYAKPDNARPESISVTARIIRGKRNKVPQIPLDPTELHHVELYASPLTVKHKSTRPTTSPPSPLKPPKPRYARSISSASSELKTDPFATAARRDSISSRLSSTPSFRGSEPELPRSMSDSSINGLDGHRDEKKESRKSRLLKRMSNISSASKRSLVSALSPVRKDIKDEPIVEHHEAPEEPSRPAPADIGDVNVQFPDTLVSPIPFILI